MKQEQVETKSKFTKTKQGSPPPPPPPPPLPRFWVKNTPAESVTKQEIAKFWRKKRVEQEDHLLAAIKAAARIRARNLSEVDYKQFEESLKDEDNNTEETNVHQDQTTGEVRVGIKDWWTKSKYAYLNQPAIDSTETPKKRTSSYAPNCFTYKATPLYPTSLGVF